MKNTNLSFPWPRSASFSPQTPQYFQDRSLACRQKILEASQIQLLKKWKLFESIASLPTCHQRQGHPRKFRDKFWDCRQSRWFLFWRLCSSGIFGICFWFSFLQQVPERRMLSAEQKISYNGIIAHIFFGQILRLFAWFAEPWSSGGSPPQLVGGKASAGWKRNLCWIPCI